MIALALFILIALAHINGLLAILWLIFATLAIPGVVIQRREHATGPEFGADAEHLGWGAIRLFGNLTLDLTGIVLGVLILLAGLLGLHLLAGSGGKH